MDPSIPPQALSANANVPEIRIGTGLRFAQTKTVFSKELATPAASSYR